MPTPEVLETADAAALARYGALIDVRSPAEFAEDHVPGAINLPVLDDEERARVGAIYVQDSAFKARRLGAALVARNVARHLEESLADRPAAFRPLIYCWRGGQRSNAMATILGQIGWRTAVLAGGYRTYRRRVQGRLYDQPLGLDLVLLDGSTGSGKTAVLQALAPLGVQAIDLEALAEHRGSLFGGYPGRTQPSQKLFESRLLAAIEALDPARPVVVEAESHKVGERMLPPALWRAMADAPRITLVAPLAARARYVAETYAGLATDRAALEAVLARLPVHIGKSDIEALRRQLDAGDLPAFAEALMALHYDPAYARSGRTQARGSRGQVLIGDYDAAAIAVAAGEVMKALEQSSAMPTREV